MKRKTVGLIILLILGISVIIMSWPTAEADTPEVQSWSGINSIHHVLVHIWEEEQKQTALLDHMDCMQYMNYKFRAQPIENYCGEPLNYTGVWRP